MRSVEIYTLDICGSSQLLRGDLKKVNFKYEHFNVESHKSSCFKKDVRGTPTIILYEDSKEVKRLVGYRKNENILEDIKEFLSGSKL